MKKLISVILAAMLIFSLTISVNAEDIRNVFETEKSQTVVSISKGTGLNNSNTSSKHDPRGETKTFDCGTTLGTVTAVFNTQTHTLTISGSGAMKNFSSYSVPWADDRNDIFKVVISNGVTGIGSFSLYDCKNLTSVTIANSVTTIGNGVFQNCENLTSLTLPNNLTSIGDSCFHTCKSLTSLTIPNSVTSIGTNLLYNCENLTSVTLPNNLTKISNFCFYNCKNLASIKIPNSVTSLGNSAFCNCKSLKSVTLPGNLTSIGNTCFSGCTILESAPIPNSVTSIGNSGFENCKSLKSVTIPGGVTTINNFTFYGCTGLTSLTISNGITKISDYAFYNCTGLTSVTLPSSVTTIGNSVFQGCKNLSIVSIPNSVTSIGNSAFYVSLRANPAIFYFNTGDNLTVGNTVLHSGDLVVGYKPSSIYDYCNSTNTLSRFIEYGVNYNINLNTNGGTLPSGTSATISKAPGTNYTLPVPTRTNYVFIGWTTDPSASDNNIIKNNILTETLATDLYAVWYLARYTVTFEKGDNDVQNMPSPATYTKTYGQPLTIPATEPTKEGYIFAGWTETPNIKTPGFFAGDKITKESLQNIVLYPLWSEQTVEVTLTSELFDQNHSSIYHSNFMPMVAMNLDTDGTPVNHDTDKPEQENTFKLWTNDPNTRSQYTISHFSDTGTFLMTDKSTGDYYFDSRKAKAFFIPSKNEYRVFSGSSGNFLPIVNENVNDNGYYFSLSFSGEFIMPINGQVQYNNTIRPMTYSFSGDDLVYVYIDGVKILNGGSGDFTPTSINFATGDVITIRDDVVQARGAGITVQTNLRERYKLAYKEAHPECTNDNDPGLLAYLKQYFEDGSNTFKVKTEHTFKMFYAESYAVSSNINVRFNIPFTGAHDLLIDPSGGKYEGSYDKKHIALEYTETYTLKDATTDSDKYLFTGWTFTGAGYEFDSDTKIFTMGYSDTTATANWTPVIHTLTVDPNSGVWKGQSSKSYIQMPYSSDTDIANPTRTGYTFTGWTMTPTDKESKLNGTKFTMGSANTTLTANWRGNNYKIRFVPNGGTYLGSTNEKEVTATFGIGYDMGNASSNPTRTGYTFTGWAMSYAQSTIANWSQSVTGTFADSTPAAFTAVANTRKGITSGENIILPTDKNNSVLLFNLCIQSGGTAILTAQWKINEHTVTYNGGEGLYQNKTSYVVDVVYDELVTIDTNKFENDGYVFVGWNTKEDGTGNFIEESSTYRMGDEDLVLYAMWEKADFAITYIGNGGLDKDGKDTAVIPYTLSMPAEIADNMFIRKGYDFIGWSTEQITKEINDSNINEIDVYSFYQPGDYYLEGEPLTLYAVWKKVDSGSYMDITDTDKKNTDTSGSDSEGSDTGSDEPVPDKPLYGDVDCNGKVTMEDVVALQKIIAKLATHEDYGKMSRINSECTHEGDINMIDVTEIQKFLAKLIPDLDP